MQNDESLLSKAMLRCSLILLKAKNNTRTPKSKFWNDIISNLKSFPRPQKCIQPFIYRYFSMFYTQKNEHNISFFSYYQNVQKHAFTVSIPSTPFFYIKKALADFVYQLKPLLITQRKSFCNCREATSRSPLRSDRLGGAVRFP